MGIADGNLFESMRLMLPEHRDVMTRLKREQQIKKKPILSQQKWEDIGYVISDAIEHQTSVCIQLFNSFEDEFLEGIPEARDGVLYLNINGDRKKVPFDRLIDVEAL